MPGGPDVLTVPEPKPKFDDPSFYDRGLLESWSFRMAMALIGLGEFALFTFAGGYWHELALSDRGMVIAFALILPFSLFREIFEHERMRNRLAGLDPEGRARELTKRAARLTYDRLFLPSMMLVLAITTVTSAIRSYHAAIANGCHTALR